MTVNFKIETSSELSNADKGSQCHSEQPASYPFFKKEENDKKNHKDFGNP